MGKEAPQKTFNMIASLQAEVQTWGLLLKFWAVCCKINKLSDACRMIRWRMHHRITFPYCARMCYHESPCTRKDWFVICCANGTEMVAEHPHVKGSEAQEPRRYRFARVTLPTRETATVYCKCSGQCKCGSNTKELKDVIWVLAWYTGEAEGHFLYGLCAVCTVQLSANDASVKLKEDTARTVGASADNGSQGGGI